MPSKTENLTLSEPKQDQCHLFLDEEEEDSLSHDSVFSGDKQQNEGNEQKSKRTSTNQKHTGSKSVQEWTH